MPAHYCCPIEPGLRFKNNFHPGTDSGLVITMNNRDDQADKPKDSLKQAIAKRKTQEMLRAIEDKKVAEARGDVKRASQSMPAATDPKRTSQSVPAAADPKRASQSMQAASDP